MGQKRCGSCGGELSFFRRESVQLGRSSLLLGDWPNLLAGAQELEFWLCPACGKLEFYLPEGARGTKAGEMARRRCPACGAEHALDDPRCPRCGERNGDLY